MNPYAASFFLLSAPATHFAFLSREEVLASLLSRGPASVCVLETYLFYNSPSIPISNGVRGLLTRVESTSTSERLYMCYKVVLFCPVAYLSIHHLWKCCISALTYSSLNFPSPARRLLAIAERETTSFLAAAGPRHI